MEAVDSRYPYASMLPQSETERLLEEIQCAWRPGRTRCRSHGNQPRADGAEAILRHADGREEKGAADWLAGCDGAHSLVRHTVGAAFAGETTDSDWMLADVHMRGYPVPDTEATVYWRTDGAFVIFPISPGRYRVFASCRPVRQDRPAPSLEQVQAMIERRGPPGMTAYDPIWLAGFRIMAQTRKLSLGRAFLLRRRRSRPQSGRRSGHEHRHAGRLQPGLEAGRSGEGLLPRKRCSTATAPSAAK